MVTQFNGIQRLIDIYQDVYITIFIELVAHATAKYISPQHAMAAHKRAYIG
jgi:hypothetical protein